MNVRLLTLGFLIEYGPAHGYELRKAAEESAAESWAGVLPGSIYHALKQMEKEGLVRLEATPAKGHQTKAVYAVTAAGRNAFQELVRQSWREKVTALPTGFYGAVNFYKALPKKEVREAIKAQIEAVEKEIDYWKQGKEVKAAFLEPERKVLLDNGLEHLLVDLKTLQQLAKLLAK
jgi:DNA-binding PadR family transcriptional regulator